MSRKKPEPNPPGRPTRYRPEYDEQTRRLCLLGYSDKRLATFFDVAEVTINDWKKRHPSFKAALRAGKDEADGHVVSALYQRACGYERKAKQIMQYQGVPVVVEFDQHYPPDTAAAALWLVNRQPELWRAKREDEIAAAVPVGHVQITVVQGRPDPLEQTA